MTIRSARLNPHTARAQKARAVLELWFLLGFGVSQAQEPLADSVAWEPLGDRLRIESFAFSGNSEEPLVWALGVGLRTIQDVSGPWTEIGPTRPRFGSIQFYGHDPSIPDTIFAGASLHRSTDGGQAFIRIEPATNLGGSTGIDGPGFDFTYPGVGYSRRIIAGDGPGFLLSTDVGDAWASADTTPPLYDPSIKALQSGRILAAGFYGAVLSDDGGHTWHHIPALYDTEQIRYDVRRIAVLPGFITGQPGDSEEGRVVLSGTQGGSDGGWFQWYSDDEGESWTRTLQPGNAGCGNGVDIVPLGSETGAPGDVAAVTCHGWVLLSNDGAETWTEIGRVPGVSPETDTIVKTAALGPDGRLYVGTSYLGPGDAYSYRTKWRASDGFAVAGGERPGRDALRLAVSPNPSQLRVEIALVGGSSGGEQVELVVVDGLGREVARRARASRWRLDVSGWAAGVYRARVEGNRQLGGVAFTVVR